MDHSPETVPEHSKDRPLSENQLDQAAVHTWSREMQATGYIAIPTAVALAVFGEVPLAIGAGALGVASLSLAALQRRAAKKKRDAV